jgi:pseudouridine-5'-monophosphatase
MLCPALEVCYAPTMRLPRPVQHVIFDMDGVLLDTERFYTEVTQAIVGRYGKTFDWSVKANMVGRPALDSARYLVEALELPISPETYLQERETKLEALFTRSEPCRGARELTTALASRDVRQVVATSSARRIYEIKTRRHVGWFQVFAAVIVGDDPRLTRGKPAPDIFLLAARELGVDPATCVVIEDSPAGVAAAHAAGMQAVAVPDPAMDRGRFPDAELVVDSLAELTPADLGFGDPRA